MQMKSWLIGHKEWLLANWRLVAILLALFAGIKFSVQSGPPGSDPTIVLILPEGDPLAIRAEQPAQAVEWVMVARLALKAAVAILERRAPNTPSDRDDKLLAFLKLISLDRAAFERADRAARSP
jgi:hypothetical protein